MKKKLLIIFTLLILIQGIFIVNKASASSSLGGYKIENYDIKMNVNEDNSIDITEVIDVYFFEKRHGIYRTIPLKNDIEREDGSKSRNKVRINNIDVSEKYSTSRENGNLKIQIGNADKYVKGSHTYKISYTYKLGKDPLKDVDELYYNLIGTEWDVPIEYVSFEINMPEKFDEDKLGFSSGSYGTVGSSDVEWDVDDNVITGECYGLDANEALTVRLELPEGYFVYDFWKENTYYIVVSILCIFVVVYAYFIWLKYGKDEKPIETVEFYPPNNLNSSELQYLYDGSSSREGVMSLLIYLANKGYLRIETDKSGKKNISGNEKFDIVKLKDYDGDNSAEELFFKGLFNSKKNKENEIRVSSSSLENKFYKTIDKVQKHYDDKKHEIFEEKPKGLMLKLILVTVLTLIGTIGYPFTIIAGWEMIFVLLFPVIAVIAFTAVMFSEPTGAVKVFMAIWAGMFGGLPFVGFILPFIVLYSTIVETITFIIGTITLIILIIIINAMPKRNEYGTEMLGKIKGFRNFLETAEKERLEALVEENPNYFFDILPYTYSLGVSKKWIKKFESIAIAPPTWYDGYTSGMSTHALCNSLDNVMRTANSSMSSSPSSSGGGSSGGGFSGGGSGGGRRWLLVN